MASFLRKAKMAASKAHQTHPPPPVPPPNMSSQPPPPPTDGTYDQPPPPPPDGSYQMPATGASDSIGANRRSSSSNPTGLLHTLKLGVKGDASKKIIAGDADLTKADGALETLITTFSALAAAVESNSQLFFQLAHNQRTFCATMTPIYLEGDPALNVVRQANDATSALMAFDAEPDSPLGSSRRSSTAALQALNRRIQELQKQHDTRVALTRERNYYTDKVRQLQASSSAKPKDQEKLSRNEQKLRELSATHAQQTSQFYAELKSVYEARGSIADQVLKSYIASQASVLSPFTPIAQAATVAKIGERDTPRTLPAPEPPVPATEAAPPPPPEDSMYLTASNGSLQPPPPPPDDGSLPPPPPPPPPVDVGGAPSAPPAFGNDMQPPPPPPPGTGVYDAYPGPSPAGDYSPYAEPASNNGSYVYGSAPPPFPPATAPAEGQYRMPPPPPTGDASESYPTRITPEYYPDPPRAPSPGEVPAAPMPPPPSSKYLD